MLVYHAFSLVLYLILYLSGSMCRLESQPSRVVSCVDGGGIIRSPSSGELVSSYIWGTFLPSENWVVDGRRTLMNFG